MAKKRDWSAIVQSNAQQSREDAKSKFEDVRAVLSTLPEDIMQPKGDSSFQMETPQESKKKSTFQNKTSGEHIESHESFQMESEVVSHGLNQSFQLESLVSEGKDVVGLMVPVELLKSNPFNARYYYDDSVIVGLAESLLNDGQKQSVLITNDPESVDQFLVIDGEYRFRASKHAGLKHVRCDFYPNVSKEELYYVSNLVNETRTAQTVFDNAKAWQKIIDKGVVANATEVASLVKKNASIVSKTLSLNSLDESITRILSLSERNVGLAIAYEFSLLAKSIDRQKTLQIAESIANGELTIKDIEKLKRTLSFSNSKNKKVMDYQKSFSINGKKIGDLKVVGGKISLSINFNSEYQDSFIKELETIILQYNLEDVEIAQKQ